ncbi:MAG: MFS transporter [Promethearchaeota archaeon]
MKNSAKEKSVVKDLRVTPDFDFMTSLIIWMSLGFFFVDFIIPFVVSQIIVASGVQLGLVYSASVIGSLIFSPIGGMLADRVQKRKMVFGGCLGRGFAYFLLYFAVLNRSVVEMMVGNFFLGGLASFFWIAFDSLISQKSNKNNRSYAFGRRGRASGIGTLIGGVFGSAVFSLANLLLPKNHAIMFIPLIFFAFSNFISGIIFLLRIDENLTFERFTHNIEAGHQEKLNNRGCEKQSAVEKIPVVPHTTINCGIIESSKSNDADYQIEKNDPKSFIIGGILLILVLFMSVMNKSMCSPFYQVFLLEHMNKNPVIVMLAWGPAGIISMLIAPKLGEIADKLNPYISILIYASLGSLVTWILINSVNIVMFSMVLVADVSLGMAGGLFISSIFSRISKQHRGKIFGTSATIQSLGGMIGPILGGIAWDVFNHYMPFIISIIIELSLIPVFTLAFKLVKHDLAEKFDNY